MSDVVLYLAGRVATEGRWEFLGIFSDMEQAEAACRTKRDFVTRVTLNRRAPEEAVPFPEAYYPKARG